MGGSRGWCPSAKPGLLVRDVAGALYTPLPFPSNYLCSLRALALKKQSGGERAGRGTKPGKERRR